MGLCRARHAAVEASIVASRLRWLGAERVGVELDRLQELVDKTAGPREREAMAFVRSYVAAAVMTEIVVSAPARLHLGMLDPAGLGRRRFGGFGVAIESPRVVVAVRWASNSLGQVTASGPQADRAAAFARSVRAELGISGATRARGA